MNTLCYKSALLSYGWDSNASQQTPVLPFIAHCEGMYIQSRLAKLFFSDDPNSLNAECLYDFFYRIRSGVAGAKPKQMKKAGQPDSQATRLSP
jgi:hypothetical protein